MNIKRIHAREILDSRGNPTVEATVVLNEGVQANAKVPSGASTGTYEAVELRDGGKRYGGLGVLKAVKHIETIIQPALVGKSVFELPMLDANMIELDGTEQKSHLGANALLAVSLALARAGALARHMPLYAYLRKIYDIDSIHFMLPVPTMNILNGGLHARNSLSIQEFMIIPHHKKFAERVRIGTEIFHTLQRILIEEHYFIGVGDEGGFSPNIPNGEHDNEHALKLIVRATEQAGYTPGKHVFLGLDLAASEFFKKGLYYMIDEHHAWSAEQMIDTLVQWTRVYPLVFIEDGLAEDDWEHWQMLTKKMNKKISLVGDDLFVTNKKRLERGIKEGVANTVLIKPNQIGTLTETMQTIQLAQRNGYKVAISHRSGETADTFIADLAVAVNADFIKTGSLSRSERVEKYNRLMEIERELYMSS